MSAGHRGKDGGPRRASLHRALVQGGGLTRTQAWKEDSKWRGADMEGERRQGAGSHRSG